MADPGLFGGDAGLCGQRRFATALDASSSILLLLLKAAASPLSLESCLFDGRSFFGPQSPVFFVEPYPQGPPRQLS